MERMTDGASCIRLFFSSYFATTLYTESERTREREEGRLTNNGEEQGKTRGRGVGAKERVEERGAQEGWRASRMNGVQAMAEREEKDR